MKNMSLLLIKLILRDAWYHRARISLAVLATMAMTCMVVWLIGSLDLMILRFESDGENYLGSYSFAIAPSQGKFPQQTIDELNADPFVELVTGACQIRNTMAKMNSPDDDRAALRRQRAVTGMPIQSPVIIGIDVVTSPFELYDGRWFNVVPNNGSEPELEGVIGTAAASSLRIMGEETKPVRVGDTVICRVDTRDYKIKVVGLVEQKLTGGGMGREVTPAVGAIYVPIQTANIINSQRASSAGLQPLRRGQTANVTDSVNSNFDYVYVRLRDGTDVRKFIDVLTKRYLSPASPDLPPPYKFYDADTIQETLNNVRKQDTGALIGSAASKNAVIIFSTLVSILIVFTTLSMGVSERSRVFAMLRTVGMPRVGIAILVFGESVVLSVFGWLCGMFAGWIVLQLTVTLQPAAFGGGKTVSLGTNAMLIAGAAALVGSLLAAIYPAIRGASVNPLDGMNRSCIVTVNVARVVLFAIVGAALLFVCPLFAFSDAITESTNVRVSLYSFIGIPTQILGCLMIVPFVIVVVEKILAPLFAKLLRVRRELLANQLSCNMWRTLGTAVAISVGLGVYAFLEIAGYSMLVPYTQTDKIPNTLVTFLPTGLPYNAIDSVRDTAGVDRERFLPIALEQSNFSEGQSEKFIENGLNPMQASAVIFGVDVNEAFGKRHDGKRPLIEVEFQEGTFADALSKLQTGGRYCVIPDSFAFRAGLHVGDKLELVVPNDERPQRGRRGGGGRPPARIAVPTINEGTNSSPNEPHIPKDEIIEYEVCGVVTIPGWLWMTKLSGVRKRGARSGAMLIAPYETVRNDFRVKEAAYFWFDRTKDAKGKPTVSDNDLEESLQVLAESFANRPNDNGDATTMTKTIPMVKVNSREYLLDNVNRRADDVIQAAAKMPLIILAISSIGLMGTVAASVRVRRFELGVLRSLGMTRFGIIRMILAEALLIAVVAIVVSVGFGTLSAWCFIGIMRYTSFFGGFVSPLTIPFYYITIGFAVTLFMSTLAALVPALFAGRTEITALLRE